MRQFVLGTSTSSVVTGAIDDFSAIQAGKFALVKTETESTGKYKGLAAGDIASAGKRFQLVMGRDNESPVVIPIYNNHFSAVVMKYAAATQFSVEITVPTPAYVGEYTVIIAKKGVQFNERNKFTSSVYVKDTTSMTDAQLALKLAAAINANSVASEVSAAVGENNDANIITITASKYGVDYEVLVADSLSESGAVVGTPTVGSPAMADEDMIKDMANKAAADAGFNDTYLDGAALLYPAYPIDRSTKVLGANGFDVLTLRFAEPREMKTRDEVVHQIVQIAVPKSAVGTDAPAIQSLKTIFDAFV